MIVFVYVKMLGFNILLKRMADSVSNITGCGCALTRLANPQCILVLPASPSPGFKYARPLSTPSDVSTYVNIYIELCIYIYMCMCVFMCCHIHYPSNLIVPIKICLISATDDFVFIYFGARIPGFGLSHLFVPPGALACVSSGRTLRTAHVPIVQIIPCK